MRATWLVELESRGRARLLAIVDLIPLSGSISRCGPYVFPWGFDASYLEQHFTRGG